jgi:hypothetical protein
MRVKRNNRLRFHLGKGENFMKWQLRNKEDGILEYYNPTEFVYTIKNGKLNNRRNVAKQIYGGSNKTVCSWISFDSGSQDLSNFNRQECLKISYNPRVKPHWVCNDIPYSDMDGFEGDIYIDGKTLYVKKDQIEEYLNVDLMEIEEVQLEKDIKNNLYGEEY